MEVGLVILVGVVCIKFFVKVVSVVSKLDGLLIVEFECE